MIVKVCLDISSCKFDTLPMCTSCAADDAKHNSTCMHAQPRGLELEDTVMLFCVSLDCN